MVRRGGENGSVPRACLVAAIAFFVPSASFGAEASIIRVPQDERTIAAAIRSASPGDVVLLDRGTYPGDVVVPESRPGITIRGVDRNAVVFDGDDRRDNALVVRADGVALENMSAHGFLENGFYWQDVRGFSGSYLTVWNVRRYGIYAEGSMDGVVHDDYVSGAGDAAYYVGECDPCRTTLRGVVARLSAVGYSGTNASGGLVIRDSLWDRNGAGILPNSYADEADPPQHDVLITDNTVTRSGRARVPLNTPLAGYYGIGIGVAGGNGNRVLRNTVSGSRRYGIAVFSTPYRVQTRRPPWRPQANAIRANVVRGSGLADLALSASARSGNCFRGNRASTALPARLQKRPCRAKGGDRRVARALEAPFRTLLTRASRAIR